jgi:hypothetical protein
MEKTKTLKTLKKILVFLVFLAASSSCVNSFFDRLLETEEPPEEQIEIEASLSWRNDWIEEGPDLSRDTDNEFASVPGNPLKAVHTDFLQDSFEPSPHPSATAVYPAQKWESRVGSPNTAAFVIYYRIPGVGAYDSDTENLYFRVSWDGGALWGPWGWAVNSAADLDWFETKDGDLLFKTGQTFANDSSGWDKKGDYLTVEIALFETPDGAPTGPYRDAILSVQKRLKQRIFTVDLSDVCFDPDSLHTFPPTS